MDKSDNFTIRRTLGIPCTTILNEDRLNSGLFINIDWLRKLRIEGILEQSIVQFLFNKLHTYMEKSDMFAYRHIVHSLFVELKCRFIARYRNASLWQNVEIKINGFKKSSCNIKHEGYHAKILNNNFFLERKEKSFASNTVSCYILTSPCIHLKTRASSVLDYYMFRWVELLF